VISGIVHVLKSGGRWVDAPRDYGPKKTLYNRFVRWAAKGVWVTLFQALAQAAGPPAEVLIDSSAVKAHRSRNYGDTCLNPQFEVSSATPPCRLRPRLRAVGVTAKAHLNQGIMQASP
jgi:hypothetical protein